MANFGNNVSIEWTINSALSDAECEALQLATKRWFNALVTAHDGNKPTYQMSTDRQKNTTSVTIALDEALLTSDQLEARSRNLLDHVLVRRTLGKYLWLAVTCLVMGSKSLPPRQPEWGMMTS
jgi:hypothetical protein